MPDVPAWPVFGMFSPRSAGWLRMLSGVSPCDRLPDDLAAIEIDRRDEPVGRLQDRDAVDGQAARVAPPQPRQERARAPVHRRRGPRRSGERVTLFGPRRARRIGRAAVARSEHFLEGTAGDTRDVADIREAGRRRGERRRRDADVVRRCVGGVRVRIVGAAGPVRAADGIAHVDRTEQTVHVAEDRGVVHPWPDLVARDLLDRLLAQRGREVDQVVRHVQRRARVGWRLGRERLRRARLLARHVGLRNRTLFDRPHRLPGRPIEHPEEALLARHGDRLDRAAVHGDVREHGRRRHVVVPERVMDELEVPLPLAGPQIDGNEAFGKQVVAGTVAAVEVGRRRLNRQIHEAEFLVGGDLGPHARVAVHGPRVVFPRVVAEFTGPRNRVERPEQLAGARVEGADQPLGVVVRADGRAFAERRADDDRCP